MAAKQEKTRITTNPEKAQRPDREMKDIQAAATDLSREQHRVVQEQNSLQAETTAVQDRDSLQAETTAARELNSLPVEAHHPIQAAVHLIQAAAHPIQAAVQPNQAAHLLSL